MGTTLQKWCKFTSSLIFSSAIAFSIDANTGYQRLDCGQDDFLLEFLSKVSAELTPFYKRKNVFKELGRSVNDDGSITLKYPNRQVQYGRNQFEKLFHAHTDSNAICAYFGLAKARNSQTTTLGKLPFFSLYLETSAFEFNTKGKLISTDIKDTKHSKVYSSIDCLDDTLEKTKKISTRYQKILSQGDGTFTIIRPQFKYQEEKYLYAATSDLDLLCKHYGFNAWVADREYTNNKAKKHSLTSKKVIQFDQKRSYVNDNSSHKNTEAIESITCR